MTEQADGAAAEGSAEASIRGVPRVRTALAVGAGALVVVAGSAWLATRAGAEQAQTGLLLWFNAPPQPVAALFAVVNPLFRPVPLALLGALVLGWALMAAGDRWRRWEIVRAAVVAAALAELVAQPLKRIADQPRPLAVVAGLDMHGYPHDPLGLAYPSAHTAVLVGLAAALWPWMRRAQRIVGTAIAVLGALNRVCSMSFPFVCVYNAAPRQG